jgi:hypothetical protein
LAWAEARLSGRAFAAVVSERKGTGAQGVERKGRRAA